MKFKIIIIFCFLSFASIIQPQSPYKLSREVDIPIVVVGSAVTALDIYLINQKSPLGIEELNSVTQENVNSFDKGALTKYSTTSAKLSDIFLITSVLSPLLLFTSSAVRDDSEIIITMCAENALLYYSIPHLAKSTTDRYRPYVYNPEVPLEKKLTVESRLSFFSGHTTPAFANAVFLSKIYSDYYPDSKWKPYVWTVNLLFAVSVGYLRYNSGSHFPTDVITGAIVGTAIGFFIPLIHKNEEDNSQVLIPVQPRELFFFKFAL